MGGIWILGLVLLPVYLVVFGWATWSTIREGRAAKRRTHSLYGPCWCHLVHWCLGGPSSRTSTRGGPASSCSCWPSPPTSSTAWSCTAG